MTIVLNSNGAIMQENINNTTENPLKTEKQFREELELLTKEANSLNEQRIRIQTEVERAKKERDELEASLLAEYGTTDLDTLNKILIERHEKNLKSLEIFKSEISSLKESLVSVSVELNKIK